MAPTMWLLPPHAAYVRGTPPPLAAELQRVGYEMAFARRTNRAGLKTFAPVAPNFGFRPTVRASRRLERTLPATRPISIDL